MQTNQANRSSELAHVDTDAACFPYTQLSDKIIRFSEKAKSVGTTAGSYVEHDDAARLHREVAKMIRDCTPDEHAKAYARRVAAGKHEEAARCHDEVSALSRRLAEVGK